MSSSIGTILLGYTILREIGEGGMGKVYLAENQMIGQQVAIKILDPILARNPDVRERFAQEARIHVALQHQNIVRVLNAHSSEELSFLVMEYVDGQSLDKVLKRRGKLSVDDAIKIFTQVLDAVGYAHDKGIIHRDLKPSNIIVCGDGAVKVTDFGIAKVLGDTKLTRTGTSMCSADYMSPEQVLGKRDIDHRTDIYSLGATLYEMLTGRPPFVVENGETSDFDFLIKQAHLRDIPKSPNVLNPAVSLPVADLILRALEKEPVSRFSSCQELRQRVAPVERVPSRPDEIAFVSANRRNASNKSSSSVSVSSKSFFSGIDWSVALPLGLTLAIIKFANTTKINSVVCMFLNSGDCTSIRGISESIAPKEEEDGIEKILTAIKSDNRDEVAESVVYPLFRELPLQAIKTKDEFLKNYTSFFDAVFVAQLLKSDLNTFDNWRGRSLLNGKLWISGKKITAINNFTESGLKNFQKAVAEDKLNLYPSASGYDSVLMICITKTHVVRVHREGSQLQYFSWKKPRGTDEEPSLKIVTSSYKGTQDSNGSQVFSFESGRFRYIVQRPQVCGEALGCAGSLAVYRENSEVQSDFCGEN